MSGCQKLCEFKGKVKQKYENCRNYFDVVNWQLSWVCKDRKVSAFACVFFGALNMILQGAVVGVLFLSLNQLKEGVDVPFTSFKLHMDNLLGGGVFTLILMLLLSLGSVSGMIYNKIINNLSVKYEKDLISQILAKYDRLEYNDKAHKQNVEVIRFLGGGARISSRSQRVILSTLLDVFRVLVFTVACFYLNWLLTISIVVALSPFYLAHAILNMRIHKNEKEFEVSQESAKDALKERVWNHKDFDSGGMPASLDHKLNSYLNNYKRRINATVSSEIISDLGFTLSLSLGLLFFLYMYSAGNATIGAIVAYLFSLRLLLQSLRALLVGVAVFTRHYAQVSKVKKYITA